MTCTGFLQGHEWLAQHMSLNDQMATLKGPLQLGQALQRVETLLAAAGRTKPEWEQHWRTAWQQRLARCYDPRDALMCACFSGGEQYSWPVQRHDVAVSVRIRFTLHHSQDGGPEQSLQCPGIGLLLGMLAMRSGHLQACMLCALHWRVQHVGCKAAT